MNSLVVERLNINSFRILSRIYASEQYDYIKYLTLFNNFTDQNAISEADSILLSCKTNDNSYTYIGLRGTNYEVPRFSIFVPSNLSRLGLGTLLTNLGCFIANKKGFSFLELKVDKKNISAIKLYLNCNFHIYKAFTSDSQILMRKDIRDSSCPEYIQWSSEINSLLKQS